jgi:ADP-ribosylglycohydrolase
MTGSGPFGLKPGEWTDDTAMALALADSLVSCGGLAPHDLMTRFVSWWREGVYSCTGKCFDIGGTTAAALARFEETDYPLQGSTDEDSAGDGSLMRLAPVALFCLSEADEADRLARQQSRTTHAAPQCLDACAYFVQLLREAILGQPDVLRPRSIDGHPAIAAIAADRWQTKQRDQIRTSGYVVHTLEAALWCVAQTHTFENALILAVNLGHDSDTVGAVTGQLAGALYGASAIPQRWLKPLAWRYPVGTATERLLTTRDQGRSGNPAPARPANTPAPTRMTKSYRAAGQGRFPLVPGRRPGPEEAGS